MLSPLSPCPFIPCLCLSVSVSVCGLCVFLCSGVWVKKSPAVLGQGEFGGGIVKRFMRFVWRVGTCGALWRISY